MQSSIKDLLCKIITSDRFNQVINSANTIEQTQLAQALSYLTILYNKNVDSKVTDTLKAYIPQLNNKLSNSLNTSQIYVTKVTGKQQLIYKYLTETYADKYDIKLEYLTSAGYVIDIAMINKETGEIILVEIDGNIHNSARDEFKDELLKGHGYEHIIRITNKEINENATAINKLIEAKFNFIPHTQEITKQTLTTIKTRRSDNSTSYANFYQILAETPHSEKKLSKETKDEKPSQTEASTPNPKPHSTMHHKASKKGKQLKSSKPEATKLTDEEFDKLLAEFKQRDKEKQEKTSDTYSCRIS